MSLKNTENIAVNQYKVTFDVDHATFEGAINKVYKRQVKNIAIPGFRKGKAPRSIVEKMYGKEVFYEDAINEVIPDAYTSAIEGFEKTIVSQPEFDVETIDENGVVLTATFFTKPDANIADYMGLAVTRTVKEATDAEVDEELSHVQNRNSRMIEITDRAAAMDDVANIDFEGTIDGVPFDGGKAEGHSLKLGSGQFIPGFEDGLVGLSAGESKDVDVTFPTEYTEDLAGKPAVFKCFIHEVKETQKPDLDDEFAIDLGSDNLEQLKADTRKKLEDAQAANNENRFQSSVMEKVSAGLKCDIPQSMIESQLDKIINDFSYQVQMYGMKMEDYMGMMGMDMYTLRQQYQPMALAQVKSELAMSKIAEVENIQVTEEEAEAEYKRLAENYDMDVEKIKEIMPVEEINYSLKLTKASELVMANAVATSELSEEDKELIGEAAAAAEESAKEE